MTVERQFERNLKKEFAPYYDYGLGVGTSFDKIEDYIALPETIEHTVTMRLSQTFREANLFSYLEGL